MILLLTILRWASLAMCLIVLVRFTPDALRAFRPARRRMDPVWALFWSAAFIHLWFVGGSMHNNAGPNDLEAGWLIIGNMMTIALAIGFLKLRSWYAD